MFGENICPHFFPVTLFVYNTIFPLKWNWKAGKQETMCYQKLAHAFVQL